MTRAEKRHIVTGAQFLLVFANLVLVFHLSDQFIATWQRAEQYVGPTYTRVDYWLASAECARKTGILLAVCDENGVRPIEDVSVADDPGHALIIGILGKYSSVSINKTTLVRVNLMINALGVMGLVLVLAYGRMFLATAAVLAWSSNVIFSQYLTADVWGAYFGIVALAMMLATWIGIAVRRSERTFVFWTGIVIGSGALLAASVLRQPLGMIGTFAALVLIPILVKRRWGPKSIGYKSAALAVLAVIAVLPMKSSDMLVEARELVFGLQPGHLPYRHGISHNLYIGLGSQENPWGIRWEDGSAARAVKAVRPDVDYVSNEYFDVLWKLYIERVMEDPGVVARIYALNAAEILSAGLPSALPSYLPEFTVRNAILELGIGMLLFSVAGIAAKRQHVQRIGWLLLVVIGAAGLALLQGIITMPFLSFYFPAALLIVLAAGLLLQGLAEVLPHVEFARHFQRLMAIRQKRSGVAAQRH